MTPSGRKCAAGWLIGFLAIGAAIGVAVCYAALEQRQVPGTPPPASKTEEWMACFDAQTIGELTGATDMKEVRFYAATADKKHLTAIAVAVGEEGKHLPLANGKDMFLQFDKIDNGHTRMERPDEAKAKRVVLDLSDLNLEPWSADLSPNILGNILQVKEANGIGLREVRLSDGDWSFELVPVLIQGHEAGAVGTQRDVWVAALPCPANCPWPAEHYLHR